VPLVQGLRGVAEMVAFSSQQSAFSADVEITVKNFRDLMVWQKAHALTLASYRGTAELPKSTASSARFGDVRLRLRRILLRDAVKVAMPSSSVIRLSPPDRPANSSTTYSSPRI